MTKTQSDYLEHDPDNLSEGFNAVREYLEHAVVIAWDGCHKIYLAMDEAEADFFRENYAPLEDGDIGEVFGASTNSDKHELEKVILRWFDDSCPLKFVQAVWHNEENPNAGFVQVIAQGAGDEDPYEDEDDDEGDDE